ncbi:hypothetical protein CAPTEDRAFT_64362, partial [Capitella teleta]
VPVLVLSGVIGNSISLGVFALTHAKWQACSVYLAYLNVVDCIFLLTLLTPWLGWLGVFLFHQTGWCQATIFVSYVASFLSAWIVVAFTVERFIAVFHPLLRQRYCTRSRAMICLSALSVFAILLYSLSLFAHGVVDHEQFGPICITLSGFDAAMRALSTVDTVVTMILPSIVIVIFNISIAAKVWQVTSLKTHSPRHPGRSLHWRTTRSLLVVSTIFVTLNLPVHSLRVHLVFRYLLRTDDSRTTYLHKWTQVLVFLSYINYSANFLLYCACSQTFR